MRRRVVTILSIVLILGIALALTACGGAKSNKLEIFSWWTAGGEAEGLNAMFAIYTKQYPNVQIVNATTAGGAGTNEKAVLSTRLTGGDPPDAFQLHAGEAQGSHLFQGSLGIRQTRRVTVLRDGVQPTATDFHSDTSWTKGDGIRPLRPSGLRRLSSGRHPTGE